MVVYLVNNIEKARDKLGLLKIEDYQYLFKKHLNKNVCKNDLDEMKKHIFKNELTSIDIIECVYNYRYENRDRYVLIDEYGLFSFNDLKLLKKVLFTVMDKNMAEDVLKIVNEKGYGVV